MRPTAARACAEVTVTLSLPRLVKLRCVRGRAVFGIVLYVRHPVPSADWVLGERHVGISQRHIRGMHARCLRSTGGAVGALGF